MEKRMLMIGERSATIFSSVGCADCPVIYTHFPADVAGAIATLLDDTKFVLVALDGVDWNCSLSPWPAPRAFRGGNDFKGEADAYLQELTKNIVPAVETSLGFSPCYRVIAGYSLAGLFAIYAMYHTNVFNRIASVSGSLWYDGFIDFMKRNRPQRIPEQVYFSLGDRESIVKNQRLATVENCTLEAEKLMQSIGARTILEMNSGNHFADVHERVAKGLRWIL